MTIGEALFMVLIAFSVGTIVGIAACTLGDRRKRNKST